MLSKYTIRISGILGFVAGWLQAETAVSLYLRLLAIGVALVVVWLFADAEEGDGDDEEPWMIWAVGGGAFFAGFLASIAI